MAEPGNICYSNQGAFAGSIDLALRAKLRLSDISGLAAGNPTLQPFDGDSKCTVLPSSAFAADLSEKGRETHFVSELLGHSSVKVAEQFYIKRRQVEACGQTLMVIEGGKRKAV